MLCWSCWNNHYRLVKAPKPFLLLDNIRFEGVHFCYDSDNSDVLKGLDLEIRRGERIGLIGMTGSGKSTTVVC